MQDLRYRFDRRKMDDCSIDSWGNLDKSRGPFVFVIAVPPNRISEIVNGKRAITADTALRLERYFQVEAQFWLNLQSEYDLRIMKRKKGEDIQRRIIQLQNA